MAIPTRSMYALGCSRSMPIYIWNAESLDGHRATDLNVAPEHTEKVEDAGIENGYIEEEKGGDVVRVSTH